MAKKKKRNNNSKIKLSSEDKEDLRFMKKSTKIGNKTHHKIHKYFHTHIDNYASTHGRWLEGTLFFFNFLAIVLFIIDTYDLTATAQKILSTSEIILVSIFIIEYSVRMWVAKNKLKHGTNIYSIIDLVAILPILANFGNLGFFRIFRILRLFRMLRVLRFQRIFKQKDTMFGQLTDTQLVVIRIALTVFTIIFVFSGLIWFVESKINPDYGTIWDAMYFSVVTLSTVGYGDVTPTSSWGKIISITMILTGIALIPWQLGKLIKILFMSATKTLIKCKKCGLQEHDQDSRFCRSCGKKLPKRKKILEEESA